MPTVQRYFADPNELHQMYVVEKMSTVEIAQRMGWYHANGSPNAMAVYRLLEKHNLPIRNKSDAMKISLEKGVSEHPTEGKVMKASTRLKIGAAASRGFEMMSSEKKAERLKGMRQFWSEDGDKEKQDKIRQKIGSQLRKAINEGTVLEKSIAKFLMQQGYKIEMHVDKFLGTNLEADMVIKGKGIVVVLEVDGPRHVKCFIDKGQAGREKLAQTIKTDQKKNRLVLGKPGVFMIRILYPYAKEITYVRATLEKLHEVLEHLQQLSKIPDLPTKSRIIYIDMKKVITGISSTDNPDWRAAMKILQSK